MEFANETGLPAVFARGSTTDREMVGVVAAKLTARVQDGRLTRCEGEDAWPVFEEAYAFGGVTLSPETDFRKRATDIIVFGQAVAPRGEPCAAMRVGVRCGAVGLDLDVVGDRWWQRAGGGLVPSDPLPFVTMPLTSDRAYGGVGSFQGMPVPHGGNPAGRGFAMTEEEAEGRPLPNLERPGEGLRAWTDRPAPAFFYRPSAPALTPEQVEKPPLEIAAGLMEEAGQDAVAELIARPGELGTELRLYGFDPWEEVVLPLPPFHGPDVVVQVGPHRSRFPTSIGTVVALVDERVLVVTYRCVFRYLFRPGEARTARLGWRSRSAGRPAAEAA